MNATQDLYGVHTNNMGRAVRLFYQTPYERFARNARYCHFYDHHYNIHIIDLCIACM